MGLIASIRYDFILEQGCSFFERGSIGYSRLYHPNIRRASSCRKTLMRVTGLSLVGFFLLLSAVFLAASDSCSYNNSSIINMAALLLLIVAGWGFTTGHRSADDRLLPTTAKVLI